MSSAPTSEASAAERFWRFSLAVYASPGVAAACVALQDRWGLDVNLLLWCCWHGAEGRRLSPEEVAQAAETARPWQAQVVQPLRALRRRLKSGVPSMAAARVEAVRGGLKEVELEAERVAQLGLGELGFGTAAAGQRDALARANLDNYLTLRNVAPAAQDRAALDALLDALPVG